MRESSNRKSRKGKLLFLLEVAGILFLAAKALSQIPPSGTLIASRAEASYERDGSVLIAYSNTVTVRVLSIYAPLLTPNGTISDPAASASAFSEGKVTFPFRLENSGNAVDSFSLDVLSVAPSAFVPASALIYLDADRDGAFDIGERAVAGFLGLDPGESASLLLEAELPSGLYGGEIAHLDLIARSAADTSACDRGNIVRIIARNEASLALALSSSTQEILPGDTILFAVNFSNPGERAASRIAISVPIDMDGFASGMEFVGGSACSGTPGRFEYFDSESSLWTTAEPPAHRVKRFRFLLDSLAASGSGGVEYALIAKSSCPYGWIANISSGDYTNGSGEERQCSSNELLVRCGRKSIVSIGPRGNPTAPTGTAEDRVSAKLDGNSSYCVLWHEILNGGNFIDSLSVALSDSALIPEEWEIAFIDSNGCEYPHTSKFKAIIGSIPQEARVIVGLRASSTPEGLRHFEGHELVFSLEAASLLIEGSQDRVQDVISKSSISMVSIVQSIREPVAMVGDVISFVITVENITDETPLDSVRVIERLCSGLRYSSGSMEPLISKGSLEWEIGPLAPRERREIVFRARVAAGQEIGRLFGKAWVYGVTEWGESAQAGPAEASVLIVEGIFTRRGIVSGTVFIDCDADGEHDQGERGQAGISVFIEDGTCAVTDAFGRYSIPGIVEGLHIVRIDPESLPDTLTISTGSAFSVLGEQGSVLVDIAPSGHRRVDFALKRTNYSEISAKVLSIPKASEETSHLIDEALDAEADSTARKTIEAITISSSHFRAGEAEIDGIPLEQVAALSLWIKDHPGWNILIVGHTDSIPVSGGQFSSNLELSIARARSVFQILRMNGIPETRMKYTGRGDSEPLASNATEAGRSMNRRVEIRAIPPGGFSHDAADLARAISDADSSAFRLSDSSGVCADIVRPAEGAIFHSRSQIDVDIVSPLGSEVELYANGIPVGEDRIGLRKIDISAGIFGTVFYGVNLVEGRNDLLVVCREYGGERHTCVRHVYLSGQPQQVVVEREKISVPSDGKARPEIVFLVSDSNGLPVRDGIFVDVLGPADLLNALDENPHVSGVQVATRNGRVTLILSPQRESRREVVRASLGGISAICRVEYESPLRNWFLMGLGEASLGWGSASGMGDRNRSLDRFHEGGYAEGKLAFYGQGEVMPGHVLTTAINTRPLRDDMLFRRIEPEKYYPIYGDASELRFSAASRSGAFARLDHRRYSALLGDFRTEFANTEFTKYHRAFNGLSGEVRFERGSVKAFVTNTDQATYQEEIAGEGTSGFYFLSHYPLVEGSEKVRIEIRDRYLPERIVRIDYKQANRDYDINYSDGSILFKEPIPRFDEQLNPVAIVISYECRDSGERNFLYGARSSLMVADSLAFGFTAVVEEEGAADASLAGLDLTGQLLPGVRVESEFARSEKLVLGGGNAFRVRLSGGYDEKLSWQAYYRDVDATFFNPSFSGGKTELGSRKFGAESRLQLAPLLAMTVSGYRQSLLERDERKDYLSFSAGSSARGIQANLGVAYAGREDTRDAQQESFLLRSAIGFSSRATQSEIQWDQILNGDEVEEYPNRLQMKLSRKLWKEISAVAKHEYRTGSRSGTRHLTQLGLESNISAGLQTYTRYELQGCASGERAQAILGVKNRFAVSSELTATMAIEKTATVSGEIIDDHFSLATSAVYTPLTPGYRLKGNYEIRLEPERRKHLGDMAALARFGTRLSTLLRSDIWFCDEKIDKNRAKIGTLLGLSLRPDGGDALTLLSLVRVNYEQRSPAHPEGIDRELVCSFEANYRPMQEWELEGKIAGRKVENIFREYTVASSAFLFQTQVVRTIAARWDVGLSARMVTQLETHTRSYGGNVELGRAVAENLWMGLGYDFAGREYDDSAKDAFGYRGFYFGMRFKFDEKIMNYFHGSMGGGEL